MSISRPSDLTVGDLSRSCLEVQPLSRNFWMWTEFRTFGHFQGRLVRFSTRSSERDSEVGVPTAANLSATCQRSARKEPSFLQLPTTRNARSVLPESHSVHRAQVAAVSAMESLDSTAVEEGQRKCGTDSLSNHVRTDSGPCLTQSRSSLWDGSVGLPRTTT